MLRALLVVSLFLLPANAAARPIARASATCSDFADQADAQRAANTRDGNHNGIYCDDLPCPCLKPGGHATPAPAAPTHAHRHRLGPSKRLGPVTKTSGCKVHGGLPDAACTPGVYFVHATKRDVCEAGYSARVRNVSESQKDAVYAEYGIELHFDSIDGELDHLVSLELGGTNARANLFPESATPSPGSHEKDQLENALHQEVCDGEITLRHAQKEIAGDWVAAYDRRFS